MSSNTLNGSPIDNTASTHEADFNNDADTEETTERQYVYEHSTCHEDTENHMTMEEYTKHSFNAVSAIGEGFYESSKQGTQGIAETILSDILQQVDELNSNQNELIEFMEKTVIGGPKDSSKRPSPEEIFFWTTYFFLQFCGYRFFLATLFYYEKTSMSSTDELAAMITDIVDEVAENASYINFNSDDPVKMAKNLIWQILNKPMYQRRYMGLSDAQIAAGDVMDELINKFELKSEPVTEELSEEEHPRILLFEKKSDRVPPEVISPCADFAGIFTIAKDFINRVIKSSLRMQDSEHVIGLKSSLQSEHTFPSIASFCVEVGEAAIISYIKTWNFRENWMYVLNFLMAQSDACSDYYFYELVWSLPTKIYPVAQATASVIFKIEVSRVKPETCPIDITYKYEGNNLDHTPFTYPFRESWLIMILESKLNLFKQLKF